MNFRFLILFMLMMPCFAWSQQYVALGSEDTIVDVFEISPIYVAETGSESPEAIMSEQGRARFINELPRSINIDKVNGGAYWFYLKLKNNSDTVDWVFDPYDSIIDTVDVYIYRQKGLQKLTTGFLHDNRYPFSYAVDFELQPGEEVELLVHMQSRYYPNQPVIEIKSQKQFVSWTSLKNILIIACFGAILILACYNFFLGFWMQDRSYLYYSLYLVASIVAWLGAYNGFADWFSWYSYWFLIPPFFIVTVFNTLYFLHFLELPKTKPTLTKFIYGFVVFCLCMFLIKPLFTMGQYMILWGMVSICWGVLALTCGVIRLVEGYKPARFFVLAFSILVLGILASLLPMLNPAFDVKNEYLISLGTQTLDMLLLSLALADRINILREDKESALKKALATESWAIEKEREANTKLQQALGISEEENQRKSDFLRMVSHELRTPLYSIISSVEQWDELDDEKSHKDLLEYMGYGAARLRMQVDNLVLLAETDNQTLEPATAPFDIKLMLSSLCENVQGLVGPDVEFEFSCIGTMPEALNGDSYLIQHMIRTVLENACKYTEHGKVVFDVRWVEGVLVFKVSDTGCGMTREQERTMFNDFVQVSRGLERNSEGLGIGLTVCYRLSDILGADLNIQSTLGEGTEVIIELPITPVEQQLETPHPERIEKAEVLIVEDNLVNAQILQSLVELMGAVPTMVESGQDALALLDRRGFDLILMDIQMPVMDGITATRWIRRRNHFMPIVAVTANSDAEVRKRCVEVGMNDFLVKPIRRSDLQRVMERQLLAKKPY